MAITEINARYTLTGPDGTVAVFNDQTDPNFIGMLTEVTGLDSPEVRESADDLVQMDGGIHGTFFYGRRPITMTGLILNPASITERNARQLRLSQASSAMRSDATLSWTPSGYPAQQICVRRQQPLRVTGAWQKQFQMQLVAADPRVYSAALNSSTIVTSAASGTAGRTYAKSFNIAYSATPPLGQLLLTNAGNATTFPVLRVYGPGNNPVISNFTTGQQIKLIYTLGAGDWLTVDTLNRTVMLNDATSRYGSIDFINTSWWGMLPGVNDLRIAFDTYVSGSSLNVQWRDAWI